MSVHAEYSLLNQIVPYMLCALYGVPIGVYRLHHCVMHHVVSFITVKSMLSASSSGWFIPHAKGIQIRPGPQKSCYDRYCRSEEPSS